MYKLVRPIFFAQKPERAHAFFQSLGSLLARSPFKSLIKFFYDFEDSRLHVEALGMSFKNPIGLAAGFDKHAKLSEFLPALGFGFTEIGSVSARPAEGNPKPRLFRLPEDRALINRMGLNNEGAEVIAHRINGQHLEIPLGINIVKTNDSLIMGADAISDFCASFQTLYQLSSFMVINISCPNTADGKTFEDPVTLDSLLRALRAAETKFTMRKPTLIKLSPDVSEEVLDQILVVTKKHHISGYVVMNTSVARAGLKTSDATLESMGKGGLSGEPIKTWAVELVSYIYKKLDKPFIIGCGGVSSAEDAYDLIKAGATLVELYTGLIYEGPGLVKQINKGLVQLLQRDGYKTIQEAVGTYKPEP